MIEVLLLEGDRATRDALSIALERFACFAVDVVREPDFITQAAEKPYRVALVDDALGADGTAHLLRRLKDTGSRVEVVLFAGDRTLEALSRSKLNLNISTFVRRPVQAVEVFRCLARLRDKYGGGKGR